MTGHVVHYYYITGLAGAVAGREHFEGGSGNVAGDRGFGDA